MNRFLDRCYGCWFTPQLTFPRLAEEVPLFQGFLVLIGVNVLDGLRLGGGVGAILQPLSATLGWLVLNGLLLVLLVLVGRTVQLPRLLTLTGFASLPWLIFGPAQIFGGWVGQVATWAVVVWFIGLQTWAVAVGTDLDWWRVALWLPFTFVGGLVALNWTLNSLLVLSRVG